MQNFPPETNGSISSGEKQGGKKKVEGNSCNRRVTKPTVSCIFLMFKQIETKRKNLHFGKSNAFSGEMENICFNRSLILLKFTVMVQCATTSISLS